MFGLNLILLFILLSASSQSLLAQTEPRSEKFDQADGLIIPWGWVWHTCSGSTPNPRPDCPVVTDKQFRANSYQRIYADDGSLWHSFSVFPFDSKHYSNVLKKEFNPLGPYPITNTKLPGPIVMRIRAASENWYEVEVNEDTRETQYVSRLDAAWSRVDWADIFNLSGSVSVKSDVRVLSAIDGEPVKCGFDPKRYTFTKLDGDWMRVNDRYFDAQVCKGWIRWRNGREILVGTVLNGWHGRDFPYVK